MKLSYNNLRLALLVWGSLTFSIWFCVYEKELRAQTLIEAPMRMPLPAASAAPSYSTSFPLTESPVSEGSKWRNGFVNGCLWNDVWTTPGLAHGTQPSGSLTTDDSTAIYTNWPTSGSNQTAKATVFGGGLVSHGITNEEVELRLRTKISCDQITGYEVTFSCTDNAYVQVVRWNGPLNDFTVLDSHDLVSHVSNADVCMASISNNVIRVYTNNVFMWATTDSTYNDGCPGMGFYGDHTFDNTTYGFSSWSATSP